MTNAAWIGADEVVRVHYNAELLSFDTLLDHAIANSCDRKVYATSDEQFALATKKLKGRVERYEGVTREGKSSDQLFYLGKSHLRYLPLTPTQARRVNSALGTKNKPDRWLSPRQQALAKTIKKVLKTNPEKLKGLARPSNLEALAEYLQKLQAALSE